MFRRGGGGILKPFCNDQEVVYAMSYDLVVLLEKVEKQTNSQTDRQFRGSNLTVAEKGNVFQKSTKHINRFYLTCSH